MTLVRRSNQRGLTLVETMAALFVFAVVTVGIVPLLASSLQGTQLARSHTVGKDVALQALERARGLPYFVSFNAQPKKVDLLDFYFPCADSTLAKSGCGGNGTRSYKAVTGVFQIECTASGTDSCALDIPSGYKVTFRSRFLVPDGSTPVVPLSTYTRNSNAQLDIPPSQLLEMSVTSSWTLGARERTFEVKSLLGDRRFGDTKISGAARVDYGIQVRTSFDEDLNGETDSDLTVIGGISESVVQTRQFSTALQRVRAGEARLIKRPVDATSNATTLGERLGAFAEIHAPPDESSSGSSVTGLTPISYGLLNKEVAFLGDTSTSGLQTSVASELPIAKGAFSYSNTSNSFGNLWVQNQADTTGQARLKLESDSLRKVLSLRDVGGTLFGDTSAEAGALGSALRRVETKANVSLKSLRLLPTSFINLNETNESHAVLQLNNFTASLSCKSTRDATASASGSWSATVKFWEDTTENGLPCTANCYASRDISGALGTTDLKTVLGRNPLVYEGVLPTDDIYLFEEVGKTGYLKSFTLKPPVAPPAVENGSLTTAQIEGAINITTVPTDPAIKETQLVISVGKLSCDALDKR